MIPPLTSADPSRAVLPTAPSSSCDCLLTRIAAVWNAFLALVESILSWCGEKIHGVGSPAEMPERSLSLDPPPKPAIPQGWRSLSEWFAVTFDAGDWLETLNGEKVRCPVDVISQPAEDALVKIQSYIHGKHLLHFVSNPCYTREVDNGVEKLLKLGAVVNSQTEEGFTPLHCAVLSRCFLAYRTLREHGADPVVSAEGGTPLQFADKIKKWTSEGTHFNKFFSSYVQANPARARLFPYAVRATYTRAFEFPDPKNLGTERDIDQIIAYEKRLLDETEKSVMGTLDQLISRPVLALVVDYLRVPNNWYTQ